MKALILFLSLLLSACATPPVSTTALPNQSVYQMDISGTLDGNTPFVGTAVGDSNKQHWLHLVSAVDVNYFTIQTCHRFEKYEDVIKTGWFETNRGYDYVYKENSGMEDIGYCVVRIGAFSKQVGAGQAYGLMIFRSSAFMLPAVNICNGYNTNETGAAICQTALGLTERVKFPGPVITARARKDGSVIPMMCTGHLVDPQTFEYTMPLGECIIEFAEVAKPNRKFVLLARGFNMIQYRGGSGGDLNANPTVLRSRARQPVQLGRRIDDLGVQQYRSGGFEHEPSDLRSLQRWSDLGGREELGGRAGSGHQPADRGSE